MTPLLTVNEAAAYAKCHRETILRMIRRGQIAALKVGTTYRISVEELTPTRREQPPVEKPEAPRLSRYVQRELLRRQPSVMPSGIR